MTTEEILFFDRLSKTWDQNEVLSTPEKIGRILSFTGIKAGMEILDLGTGTGVLIPYLADLVGETGRIKAVDISEGMIAKAKEKFQHLKNISFVKKDFESEDIAGKFDIIFLYCVYPHLHSPEITLKKLIKSNLKTRGRIIIAFPCDESFINNIHKEKKAESDLLPSAPELVERFRSWGLNASTLKYNPDMYIIEIRP